MDSEMFDNQARMLEAARRLQEVLSTGSGHDATSAELETLKARFSDVVEQLHEARHRLLTSQDNLIGSQAENERLRQKLQVKIDERNMLNDECQSLQDLISEMRLSAGWRIGNGIVRQLRWLRPFGSKR